MTNLYKLRTVCFIRRGPLASLGGACFKKGPALGTTDRGVLRPWPPVGKNRGINYLPDSM